jgi:hypothetical protein
MFTQVMCVLLTLISHVTVRLFIGQAVFRQLVVFSAGAMRTYTVALCPFCFRRCAGVAGDGTCNCLTDDACCCWLMLIPYFFIKYVYNKLLINIGPTFLFGTAP